jgi:hypothetical protein
MARRIFSVFLAATLLASAAHRKPSGSGRGENEDFVLTATLHVDPEDVKDLLGSDLGGHYMVADVKIEPKYGKEVTIDRDDFLLFSTADAEKAKPYVGTQIAGQESLVVTEREGQGHPGGGGWSIGGGPMVMGNGRNGANNQGPEKSEIKSEEKVNPLVKVLDGKMLQNAKTEKPISGLLYFPMEKQKLKDLELRYGGKENRITVKLKADR